MHYVLRYVETVDIDKTLFSRAPAGVLSTPPILQPEYKWPSRYPMAAVASIA